MIDMPTLGVPDGALSRLLSVVARELRLTWRGFADLPGGLAGHRGETAQVFARHAVIMLISQLATTVILMIWISKGV